MSSAKQFDDMAVVYQFPTLTSGPYDPTKKLKSWADPDAIKALAEGADALEYRAYPIFNEKTGKVVTQGMTLEEAARVNLLPKETQKYKPTDFAVVTAPWGHAVRPLKANEAFDQTPWGWRIKYTDYVPPIDTPDWTTHDRAVLYAIADKLGVATA